jgi:uncharacterized membrane protein
MSVQHNKTPGRIASIDLLRGLAMMLMALDHTRMYFAFGTWYAEPTDLSSTTPALFFTRWITHFCAPVFVFLAGTSASLAGTKKANTRELSWFLFTRGLWLVFAELVFVNFAWTFDITYSFLILQVIWAIGISMLVLAGLVFLPEKLILAIGVVLVFGHNLLDPIELQGQSPGSFIWYALHQPQFISMSAERVVDFVYPVLPWIGVMALGYACGMLYKREYPAEERRRRLLYAGICATLLFLVLRGFNLYGEPHPWEPMDTPVFTLLSFLNTTKYPPSLHFLLMTLGPALIVLSTSESVQSRMSQPIQVFGRVPFFFYIVHLYLIHALAMSWLVFAGREPREYVFSATGIRSGALANFGLGLGGVYLVWILVLILLYPLCNWYQRYREKHPSKWWLSYL